MAFERSEPVGLPWREPRDILHLWPPEYPVLFLGGKGDFNFLATSFYRINTEDFLQHPLSRILGGQQSTLPYPVGSGYWGLFGFDAFNSAGPEAEKKAAFVYRIAQAIVFDRRNKRAFLSGYKKGQPGIRPLPEIACYILPEQIMRMFQNKKPTADPGWLPPKLTPLQTREHYLNLVTKITNDIRNGRYYQLNLLRFFSLKTAPGRAQLIEMIEKTGGPYSAIWETKNLCIASFSPERFIKIQKDKEQLVACTSPVKGTIHRSVNPVIDRHLKSKLQQSAKDLAELHMIVDLMRNDLNQVSLPGSVRVLSSGRIQSFPTVHHLVADITARLRPMQKVKTFLMKTCPAGSITGAPKTEVMKAIREYEGRNRGCLMGNIFRTDDSGTFDSSVLIRTLQGERNSPDEPFRYTWAAGSGITLKSEAKEEFWETETKCKALTGTQI